MFEESGAVFFQAGGVVLLNFGFFFFFFSLLFCLLRFNPAQSSEHRKRVFLDCVWYIYLCIVLRGKGIKSHTNIDRYRGEAVR